MMVMHLPVKSIGQSIFELRVQKRKCGQKNIQKTDKQTEKRTNEQTELHQFQKEPSYDGDILYVSVKYEFDWTNDF